jgi:hypothetical protein
MVIIWFNVENVFANASVFVDESVSQSSVIGHRHCYQTVFLVRFVGGMGSSMGSSMGE